METQTSAGPSVPPPSAPPPYAGYGAAPVRQRTPLRDVVLGWRAALAVLIAGIVVGGLGGAGLMAIIDHHGDSGPGRFGQVVPQGGFGRSFGQSGSSGSDGSSGFDGSGGTLG